MASLRRFLKICPPETVGVAVKKEMLKSCLNGTQCLEISVT